MGIDEVTARMTGGTGRAAAGRVMRRHQRECRPMTERWPVTWCGTWRRRSPPVIAPSAQSGPRSSVEPAVRPGLAGLGAMKRGRDPAGRLGNNPETGCQ